MAINTITAKALRRKKYKIPIEYFNTWHLIFTNNSRHL